MAQDYRHGESVEDINNGTRTFTTFTTVSMAIVGMVCTCDVFPK